MTEQTKGVERRKTDRKEVYLPIKLTTQGNVIATGHALNLSCYGVKLGIKLKLTFKTVENTELIDEVLSTHNLKLEIGNVGEELYITTPVEVKWTISSYGEGEKIYESGLDLRLNEKQQQEWENFYHKL